jgi:hypothetical protein
MGSKTCLGEYAMYVYPVRTNKNICVFTVTCQKNLGLVGQDNFFFFFVIGKTGNSRFASDPMNFYTEFG